MSANNNDQPGDLTPSSEKFFIKYRLKAENAARGKIEIHNPSYYCSEVKEYLLLTLGGQRQERSPKKRDFDLLLADHETGKTYEDVDMVPAGSTVVISRLPKQKEEKRKQWKPVTKKERDELGDHLKKAGVSLLDHCQTQQQGRHRVLSILTTCRELINSSASPIINNTKSTVLLVLLHSRNQTS